MRSFNKILNRIFYFFYIMIVLQRQTAAFTINKHEIRDLEDHTAFFQQESLSWSISNLINNTNNITQCAGTWLLGGYNTLGTNAVFQKTYNNLPSHEIVYFAISFWILDIQDIRNLFTIYFDGQSVNTWSSTVLVGMSSGNSCGSSARDFPAITVKGKVIHYGNTITLKIKSQIGSLGSPSLPSFGFRDVNLLFANSSSLLEIASYCTFTSTILSLTSCLCPAQQYNTLSIPVCASCDSSCESCLGPSNKQCTSCNDGYWFDGDMCNQCHASCKQCNGASESSCLRCAAHKFLHWNGTCQSSCESPLISRTEGDNKYCDLPCENSEYFNTLENKCQSTCASPYVSTTQGDLKICNSPCQSTEFYDFEQKTCVSSCENPMLKEANGPLMLCRQSNSTTNSSNSSTIVSSNPTTNSSISESFPKPNTNNSDNVMMILSECTISLVFPLAILASFLRPSDPTPLIVLAFFDFLKYIQYIQVGYPQQVLKLFESTQFEVFSFWFLLKTTVPRIIKENLPKHNLPEVFERRNLHSSFLINEWNFILTFMVSILIVIICWPVCILLQKSNKNALVFAGKRFKILTRWNLFLLILFANYGNLTLFTSLELRTLKIESFGAWLSFTIALFAISLSSWLICKIIYLSRQITKTSTVARHPLPSTSPISSNQKELFLKKWEASQILYRGFKSSSFATKAYLLFFAFRTILTYLIVAWFYQYPLVQITFITSINVGMLCYTLIKRPIRHLLTMIACGIYETIIFGVNICIMILVIYDQNSVSQESSKIRLGHIIKVSNLVIPFFSLAFLLFAIIISIKNLLKPNKILPSKAINTNLDMALQAKNHKVNESIHGANHNISLYESSLRYLQPSTFRSRLHENSALNGDNDLDNHKDKKEVEELSTPKQDLKGCQPLAQASPSCQDASINLKTSQSNKKTDQTVPSPINKQTTTYTSAQSSPINRISQDQLLSQTLLSFSSALQAHNNRLNLLKKLALKYKNPSLKDFSKTQEVERPDEEKIELNESYETPTSRKATSLNFQLDDNSENLSNSQSFLSDFGSGTPSSTSPKVFLTNKRIESIARRMSEGVIQNKLSKKNLKEEEQSSSCKNIQQSQRGSLRTKRKLETIIETKIFGQEDAQNDENSLIEIRFSADPKVDMKRILYS